MDVGGRVMSEKVELKPCPFCGGEAHPDNTWILSGARKWVVHCIKCGASIGFYETKKKAIEAWNRRIKDE